jgi:succinate dehydrogenase/fumarate reductase flavoprotein subunit
MAGETDYDVLVIGSGAAGLSAAVTAHEAGAQRILVAESEGVVGGSSRLSGGIVMGVGSRVQQESGVSEDADDLLHDYLNFNQYGVSIGPVTTFARRSGETIDWLQDHGVPIASELIKAGVERTKRGHAVLGGGQVLIDALHRYCREHDIQIALGRRVDRLLVRDGAVYGIAVGDDEVTAGAVVVATGGFGADLEKVAKYFPSAYAEGWSWYIGADGARGDALELGAEVRAQVTGLGNGLRTVGPKFLPNKLNEAYQPGWAVFVTGEGRRFMNESGLYALVDQRFHHIGDRGFIVFDDAAMRPPAEVAGRYLNPYPVRFPGREPFRPRNYQPDLVDEMVAKGRMFKSDTIAGLAEAVGLPEEALTGEIERYNRFCETGEDRDFGKPAEYLLPVARAPFYIAEVRPCTVNWTGYGLRIDADAQVLHESGSEIPGLYAAGECTGGVLGRAYVGSGNSLGNSCILGRQAGESAARYAGTA